MIELIIPGKVIPNNTKYWYDKKRGKLIGYKSVLQKSYQKSINIAVRGYMIVNKLSPIKDPVQVWLDIILKPPPSYSAKKRMEMIGTYAKVKPDIDNCEKTIYDAISKSGANKTWSYLIENDSQICKTNCTKIYGRENCIILRIEVLPPVNE